MSIFKRFLDHYAKPKNENSARFRREMAKKLDKRAIKYVSIRDEGMGETIIGKNGMINLRDGELILISSDQIVFRCTIEELRASELMSLEGVILTGPDLEHGGEERTVVAYYTDFYKMVTKV
ncbi:MAG: hypothetical protein IJZ37_06535 [Clostridia bacterium]|nr:hypothetical protein [Clostridia bacterium]MBQ8236318.1 hypothetical protein [Clostridia bacterium]MBQ8398387.1 hypothetical protein [Clostridia bacterium]